MWKKIIGGLIVLFVGYSVWDYYRAGFHTLPDLPEGAFVISYASGLRAVLVDIPDERETRRYFGYPADVPFYLEDAWSICKPPTDVELREFKEKNTPRPGQRLEGICRIQADEDVVVRGIIMTVPRL